ncbi:hypothetical protein I549_2110 [Mycobacterium avium subsp. avium 2285 (R)]|nr:hypothetical protein I549_2110 [Mycobacterium avium subsp. avium 2285 (R)]
MLIGFVHGVMNTDNMTISGETIDYGPCAFMEAYDPDTVFSSIDFWGRYAYGNQPVIAGWNLARFAETLLPLFSENTEEAIALAERSFGVFQTRYDAVWAAGMRAKLGLPAQVDAEFAAALIDELLALLKANHVDYTSFFRQLGRAARGDDRSAAEPAREMFMDLPGFDAWLARWRALGPDADAMDRVNPIYIPRNHLVEEALAAATDGDLDPLDQLLAAVTAPYTERPGFERYASPAPRTSGSTKPSAALEVTLAGFFGHDPGWPALGRAYRAPQPGRDPDGGPAQADDLLRRLQLVVHAQPADQVGHVRAGGGQEPAAGVLAAQRRPGEQRTDQRVAITHGPQQQSRGGRRLLGIAPQLVGAQRIDEEGDAGGQPDGARKKAESVDGHGVSA